MSKPGGLFLQACLEEKAWIRAGNPYLLPVCIMHSLNQLQIEKRNLNRKKTHIQCSQYSRKKNDGKESASQSHRCVKGDVLNLQNGCSKLWIMYEREKLLPCAQRECKQLCCLLCAGYTDTPASLGTCEEEYSKSRVPEFSLLHWHQSLRKFKRTFIAYN